MSVIDEARQRLHCKIVYYGPEGSGKSTNLSYIYDRTSGLGPSEHVLREYRRGAYDYLAMSLGEVRGFETHLHLYAVTGAVDCAASRLELLEEVDGVVFVADARACFMTDLSRGSPSRASGWSEPVSSRTSRA